MINEEQLVPNKRTGLTAQVLKALGLFGGVQCVSIVCSLVRAKLIAIWIGPTGVALFGIFNSVLDMLSNATQLNLRHSAVREISDSDASDLPRVASVVRWWSRNLGILGSLVMLAAAPLLSWISFGNNSYWWAFAWLAVPMFSLSITSGEQAIMQGSGNLRNLAKASLIGVAAGTACSVPLYYFLGINSIIPSLLVFALASFIAVITCRNVHSVPILRSESIRLGKGFLKLGMYMTISSLAATASSYAFLSYLNQVADSTITGIYQAGYTMIVKYMGLVFTAIAVEYYPRLVKIVNDKAELERHVAHEASVLLWIVVPAAIVFMICAPWLVRLLYSDDFLPVLPMVVAGMPGVIFRVLSYCLSYVILAKGDGKAYVRTEVSSAIIGLVLNIVLYNTMGILGLGIAYLLWYLIYATMVLIVCRTRYHLNFTLRRWWWIVLILLLLVYFAFMILK